MDLGHELAAAFSLGDARGGLVPAAVGWGGHNTVYRLDTVGGSWAIKERGRRPMSDADTALAIERAAYEGGVPMPRPVLNSAGGCWIEMGDRVFRCHEWIDGAAKENEETSPSETRAMERIVASCIG